MLSSETSDLLYRDFLSSTCELDIQGPEQYSVRAPWSLKQEFYQLKVSRMALCLLCLETDGTSRGDCAPLTITKLPEPCSVNHLFP